MPRLVQTTPKYSLHKRSGQARVTIHGKDHYLGPHGSKARKAAYDLLIAEFLANGRFQADQPDQSELTISELIAAYWHHAERHYVKRGRPTAEQDCIRSAFRPLRRLYGPVRAIEFGPVSLKVVRQAMIEAGMARSTINKHVGRIRRVFRWAAEEELLSAAIYQRLATLLGLQRGRCKAREPLPILPVADATVEATILHLPEVVADMVRFQRLTGCRPAEVCSIRPCDVDTGGDVWRYFPESHKMEHRGRERVVFIGPKAQEVIRRYLLRGHQSYCFVPSESERRRNALRRDHRESPMTPSQAARRPKRHRRRPPGSCYTPDSYRRAIQRACELAFEMPDELRRAQKDETPGPRAERCKLARQWRDEYVWSPNQLRHAAATEIRSQYGLEAAQVILGHSRADVTQVYAERDLAKAAMVVREAG